MNPALSNAQRILVAAADLAGDFSTAALVVRAYESNRDVFGLEGFADRYPDSNKILAAIMGRRGLLNPERGYFVKTGRKRYKLTGQARAEVERIVGGPVKPRTAPIRPPVRLDRRIDAAVNAVAFRRWRGGLGETVPFPDTLQFLATGPAEVLERAADYFIEGELWLRSGQVLRPEDLEAAARAEDFYRGRFASRLNGKHSPENIRPKTGGQK